MTVLLVVAALVVGAPLAAAALVTLASHREDIGAFARRAPARPACSSCPRAALPAHRRQRLSAAPDLLLPGQASRVPGALPPRDADPPPPDCPAARERGAESHRSDDRTLTLPRS